MRVTPHFVCAVAVTFVTLSFTNCAVFDDVRDLVSTQDFLTHLDTLSPVPGCYQNLTCANSTFDHIHENETSLYLNDSCFVCLNRTGNPDFCLEVLANIFDDVLCSYHSYFDPNNSQKLENLGLKRWYKLYLEMRYFDSPSVFEDTARNVILKTVKQRILFRYKVALATDMGSDYKDGLDFSETELYQEDEYFREIYAYFRHNGIFL
uniref:Uncharacterized protein n=1 Tax=Branchiostoma floridae TaxID=7739 RepID=C3ZLY6_BRAFL|eukprot:XP_002590456.1 hypothetical protein BRAFLDRAFT_86328 [Branchiostoma floridae]